MCTSYDFHKNSTVYSAIVVAARVYFFEYDFHACYKID